MAESEETHRVVAVVPNRLSNKRPSQVQRTGSSMSSSGNGSMAGRKHAHNGNFQ